MSDEDGVPSLEDMIGGLADMLVDDAEVYAPPTRAELDAGASTYVPPTSASTVDEIAASVAAAVAEAEAEIAATGGRRPGGRPRINPDLTQRELGRLKTLEKREHLNPEADIALAVLVNSPGLREGVMSLLRQGVEQRLFDQTEYLNEGDCFDLIRRAYIKAFTTMLDDAKCREVLGRISQGYGGHTGN